MDFSKKEIKKIFEHGILASSLLWLGLTAIGILFSDIISKLVPHGTGWVISAILTLILMAKPLMRLYGKFIDGFLLDNIESSKSCKFKGKKKEFLLDVYDIKVKTKP